MKGICFLSVIPMRSEPSDKAEMVNQVLYGETFDILQKEEKWSKIRLHHDQYEGWIDQKQWQIYTEKTPTLKFRNIVNTLFIKNKGIVLPAGSLVDFDIKENKKDILHTANIFLNTPYLWGGRTFMGIDCSGFTQTVFRIHQLFLPRDASQQVAVGRKVSFKNCATHDLAFFSNKDGKITHVGIVIKKKNTTKIIHASGHVRIDLLDENGIWKEETQAYSHSLHSIKRVLK